MDNATYADWSQYTEVERVELWRQHIAHECGCSTEEAEKFAASHADLHQLVTLVERGCDPDLAVRILI